MQTFSIHYSNQTDLKEFIVSHGIAEYKNILVQIFSGLIDTSLCLNTAKFIKTILANAQIIGTTTAGEILHGKMYDKTVLISFSVFENTQVLSEILSFSSSYDLEKVQKKLIQDDTKALILFSDGSRSNSEEILSTITRKYPNIVVAGGRAADYFKAKKSYVFNEDNFTEDGFVIASLSGDDLIVNSEYMLNWSPIGKEMKVTKSEKNKLYSVDNLPIKDIYAKYLGTDILEDLPQSVTEFPFITKKNGVQVTRTPVAVLEDESMLFGGNIDEGDTIQFSYGNHQNICEDILDNHKRFQLFPSESIFIYSCSGRKTLMDKELEVEFKMLESLAPTSGFFTFGEYFHSQGINNLLNISTTFLALSEKNEISKKPFQALKYKNNNRILNTLTHLSKVSVDEISSKNRELEKINEMISNDILYTISDLSGNITLISKALQKFSQKSKDDLIGNNYNIFEHQNTSAESYERIWEKLNNNESFIGEVHNKRSDGSRYWLKLTISPIYDESGKKVGYKSYREDISEKKNLEYLSSHDPLTYLYNRSEFEKVLHTKIKSAERYGEYFSLIIFDIDYFKKVNDTYGHNIGDEVLISMSRCISKSIREDDFLARWGGEEFVLLTRIIEMNKMKLFIEKIQLGFSKSCSLPIPHLSCSFGVSIYKQGDTNDSLFKRADEALYQAKESGRDRYEIFE